MPPPPAQKQEEEKEDWLTTYADAITLLMAFFVMLLTFAEFDIPAYEELTSGIAASVGGVEGAKSTTQSLKIAVEDISFQMQADQFMHVEVDDKGVVVELQSNAFFKPGKAELVDAAVPVLQKLAETLADDQFELYNIVVEGHTDDEPINTPQFPSNWELSIGRASTVVRLFETNAVNRSRLTAAGFADTEPKVPNLDREGRPIPENRATNRRVVLHMTPMSVAERGEYLKAREFERQQMEAAAAREAAKPRPISEQIPVPPTPEDMTTEQRQIKLALDQVIRDIHARGANGSLSSADLDAIRRQLIELQVARDAVTAPYFDAIQAFLDRQRANAGSGSGTEQPSGGLEVVN